MKNNRTMYGFRQFLLGLCLVTITASMLIFSFAPVYDLKVNDVAPRDIRAPQDFSYDSQILGEAARAAAERKVLPVYTNPSPTIAKQQYERARVVLAYLRELRVDPYATESQRYAWVLAVPELNELPLSAANMLLTFAEPNWNRVQLEFLELLNQLMRQRHIRESGLASVQADIPALIALDLALDEAALVSELVGRFLLPNVFYDQAATEAAREAARASVGPTFHYIRNDEIIVREGSVLDPFDVEVLQELGLTSQKLDLLDVSIAALFAMVLVLMLGFYLWRLQPDVLDASRQELLLVILIAIFTFLARLLVPAGELLPYLFPAAAFALLLVSTLGRPVAVGAAVFLAAVCGWIAGHSLNIAVLVLVQGLIAALTLPRYEHTGAIFRSGLLAGAMSAVTLLVFGIDELETAPVNFLLKVGVCIAGGLISGGLTVGGLFLLTPAFDLTTTFRLMELSRPNHPLLQRLLREAPATFNHVMMVASLAEQAAERIGANALLTRVGAYYHDIGKLLRPYFFAENQQGLSNPHDRLDPYTSVDVLSGHVRDGIKLAQQYHLPERVCAFIGEHHGTMRVSFFYQKAIEAAEGDADLVDEAHFCYPGPTPRSRETALLMLADGCEAATRARKPSTPEELAGVVDYIFEQRIRAGQLDDCPITMRELHLAKTTYIDLLRGAYHPRIQYPEPKKDRGDDNDAHST